MGTQRNNDAVGMTSAISPRGGSPPTAPRQHCLFPQAQNFNLSAYSRLERGRRSALADGCAVEVDIALTLDADPRFPELIIVAYWEDGTEWEHVLLNEAHAQ